MIIFTDNKSAKRYQITLRITEFMHKRKVVPFFLPHGEPSDVATTVAMCCVQFTPPSPTRRDATEQFCRVASGGVNWVGDSLRKSPRVPAICHLPNYAWRNVFVPHEHGYNVGGRLGTCRGGPAVYACLHHSDLLFWQRTTFGLKIFRGRVVENPVHTADATKPDGFVASRVGGVNRA